MANLKGGSDNAFVNTYQLNGEFFAITDSPFTLQLDFDLHVLRVSPAASNPRLSLPFALLPQTPA